VIGGQSFTRSTLNKEIQKQGLEDLRWMMRTIAEDDTVQQIKLRNPPQHIVVDNKPAREFDDVKHRIVVLFGTKLASAAMRSIENTLGQMISRATFPRTGRLQNISSNWRWKLVTPGKGTQIVTAATELPLFMRGMLLVLEPYGVPYATRVNSIVLGMGQLTMAKKTPPQKKKKGIFFKPAKPKRQRKPRQSIGFLRATVRALKTKQEFAQFAMTVVFSKQFRVPGELSKIQGTGSIVLKLKAR